MSAQHVVWVFKGAGIGLLVAAAALASGDSATQSAAQVFDILGKPVGFLVWLLERTFRLKAGTSAGLWFLLHFAYWMIIGALGGWVMAHYVRVCLAMIEMTEALNPKGYP